ncbi:uncharacterized protein LOC143846764 [Tasmannia lanceolata]|uniref:uncharacterized protein LOC143846764 n=1 Tax=Tasmannia lanceolata TaxID=3420 RepID=UPI004063870B
MESDQAKKSSQTTKGKANGKEIIKKAQWDTDSHYAWIDICKDLVRRGFRPGSHLSKEGWALATDGFNEKTGKGFTKEQMKNHWDSTEKEWQLWHSLLTSATGLSFDHAKHCIDASNDWWDTQIKRNKKYACFRSRALERCWDLEELFLDVSATGRLAFSLSASQVETQHSKPSTPFDIEEEGDEDVGTPVSSNEPVYGEDETEPDVVARKKEPNVKERVAKRRLVANHIFKNLERLATAVESKSTTTSVRMEKFDTDMTKIVRQLALLPGYERGSLNFYAACKLFKVKENRALWVAMEDDKTKIGWLHYELGVPLQPSFDDDDVYYPQPID